MFDFIEELGVRVLPNTAGCRTPKKAIATAQMARELFSTDWIKLEVIGDDDTLQPDLSASSRRRRSSARTGQTLPVTTEDLIAAERLLPPLRIPDALGSPDRHGPHPCQSLYA